jgi:pectin methylesterase-like acyl-CoA thioesterase
VIPSSAHTTHVRTPLIVTFMVLALALGLVATACAATYYVDNQHWAASPTGPGTEAQPYSTISSAVAAHKGPGVTILVKPGTYRETVTIPLPGADARSSSRPRRA